MEYSRFNNGMYESNKNHTHKKLKIALFCLVVVFSGSLWLFFNRQKAYSPSQPAEEKKNETVVVVSEPKLPNIQSTIDEFTANHPGEYAVKITDLKGISLAELNSDEQFFTASIYKLFVAYVGYQKVDEGVYNLDDPYVNDYNRGKCLDAMIRDSDSTCGETMLDELGQSNVTAKMEEYGLKSTSLSDFLTSAEDVAIILQKIATGTGLSKESQKAFLDSMKTQDTKYRLGLPAGFKSTTVYNKVGWNLDQEWHDASIVELANGQKVIVSVLSSGAGYKNMALLGSAIEKALQ